MNKYGNNNINNMGVNNTNVPLVNNINQLGQNDNNKINNNNINIDGNNMDNLNIKKEKETDVNAFCIKRPAKEENMKITILFYLSYHIQEICFI